MASKKIQKIARGLGATIGEPVPDVGGGPFGAARLAGILSARLQSNRGRPSDPTWSVSRQIPMREETLTQLQKLAKSFSSPGRAISPMQVAAQLLEKSLEQVEREEKNVPV